MEKVVVNGYLTNEFVNCKPKASRGGGCPAGNEIFCATPHDLSFITNLNL